MSHRKQRTNLIYRVQTSIETLKKQAGDISGTCDLFNDLLILGRIVPKLAEETLWELLEFFKPQLDDIHQSSEKPFVDPN